MIETYKEVVNSVEKNPYIIHHIPEEFKTVEICKLAVTQNGHVLKYIPLYLRTPELCKIAVTQNALALKYVPEELITFELCKLAVTQNSWVLEFVPEHLKTKELCEIAVLQSGLALEFVPKELMSLEFCKLALSKCGSLYYVPEHLKTFELCEFAVLQNHRNLEFVPEYLKTLKLCKIAISQSNLALEHVPKHFLPQLSQLCLTSEGNVMDTAKETQTPADIFTAKCETDNGNTFQFISRDLVKLTENILTLLKSHPNPNIKSTHIQRKVIKTLTLYEFVNLIYVNLPLITEEDFKYIVEEWLKGKQ